MTYVVVDTARAEAPVLAFTGGDLLVGTFGRPDLLGPELGRELAPLLYDSLHPGKRPGIPKPKAPRFWMAIPWRNS